MDEEVPPPVNEAHDEPGHESADSPGSVSSSNSDAEHDFDELELDNDHIRNGVRVDIAEQAIPVPEDADGEERQRGHRVELQIQIQLQTPGRRRSNMTVDYDRSLPTQHTYLGENFSRVTGCKVFEPGSRVTLPLYQCRAELMPGRTLPFMCDTLRQQSLVRHLTSGNDSMFAVMSPVVTHRVEEGYVLASGLQPLKEEDIGCTAELTSYTTLDNDEVRVICRGVQRFRMVSLTNQTSGIAIIDAVILPDHEPPPYPHHLFAARPQIFSRSPFCPPPMRHSPTAPPPRPTVARSMRSNRPRNLTERVAEAMFRALGMAASRAAIAQVAEEEQQSAENQADADGAAAAGADGGTDASAADSAARMDTGTSVDAHDKRPQQQVRTAGRHIGLLTNIPMAAFHAASYERVVERVFKELLPWRAARPLGRHELIPFSFYVLSCMPLDSKTQRDLMSIDSALQRLKTILSLMLGCRYYCCSRCGRHVCRRDNIFSMSDDGPSALYVNPSNLITEMFTVRDTVSFATAQLRPSSTEFSWFPGYSWCCSVCISCSNHIGWIFESTDGQSAPQQFFGLVQSKVIPDFAFVSPQAMAAAQANQPAPTATAAATAATAAETSD